jgi:glutamine amidotransferase-like uncharacterized protein
MNSIAVYDNGRVSTGSLLHRLRLTYPGRRILTITTDDIVNGNVLDNGVGALFMPGVHNHQSSYRDDVTPQGWRKIENFIRGGGAYVGICAGAYLATARFQYCDPDTGVTRVIHAPLPAFEGEAFGPIPQYTYANGARTRWSDHAVARLAFNRAAGYEGEGAACYSLGPYLTLPPGTASRPDYKIIARFADVPGAPIAIASRRIGKGIAVFSGVVPEISGLDMDSFNRQGTMTLHHDCRDRAAAQAFAAALAAKEPERARTWNAIVREIERPKFF